VPLQHLCDSVTLIFASIIIIIIIIITIIIIIMIIIFCTEYCHQKRLLVITCGNVPATAKPFLR